MRARIWRRRRARRAAATLRSSPRRQRRHTISSLDGLPLLPRMVCKQPRVRKRHVRCPRQRSRQRDTSKVQRHGFLTEPRTLRCFCATHGTPATHLTLADHPKKHSCAGSAGVAGDRRDAQGVVRKAFLHQVHFPGHDAGSGAHIPACAAGDGPTITRTGDAHRTSGRF